MAQRESKYFKRLWSMHTKEEYGRNLAFFKKNKAEVDFENADCQFVKLQETETENDCGQQVLLVIHNPYGFILCNY